MSRDISQLIFAVLLAPLGHGDFTAKPTKGQSLSKGLEDSKAKTMTYYDYMA